MAAARFDVPEVTSYPRRRVQDALAAAMRHPLCLVTAPAGAGKTTAVATAVQTRDVAHAWYRAAAAESDAGALLGHLEHALRTAVPALAGPWETVADATVALDEVDDGPPTLLVVDDVHELRDSPGEHVLGRLVDDSPRWLHVVVVGREAAPGLDLARRRVAGTVAEVGGDVLRWRPWEVAELFREFYGEPLRPEDAARLTHRTGGWAAGLQLFHHATRQLPLASRTRLIDDLHTRPGLVRDYLARHVMGRLPGELRAFMVDTSVLGRLEPELCDVLRGRDDSTGFLAELTSRQLFMIPLEDGRGHRYHEVLRAHLQLMLVERDGTAAARSAHHRAGRLLEEAEAVREAVHAYARAEAWDDLRRVLGAGGPVLAHGMTLAALDELPAGLVATDPWLQLARARALAGDGRLARAEEAYTAARDAFGSEQLARLPERERRLVRTWTGAPRPPARHVAEHLREATIANPAAVAARLGDLDEPGGRLVAAAAALLAGDTARAQQHAAGVGACVDVEVVHLALSRVLLQLAESLEGRALDGDQLDTAANTLEQLGLVAVARVVRAVASAARGAPVDHLLTVAAGLRDRDDVWGAALVELVAALVGLRRGDADPVPAERAITSLDGLRAPVLAAIAALCAPPARPGGTDHRRAVRHAESLGASGVAARVAALGRAAAPASRDRWEVRLHGEFGILVDGVELPVDELRPKAREGLAILLLDADRPLHEDHLMSLLWPGVEPATARHRLQVLLSSLRGFIDANGGRREMLARRGRAYVLQLPAGSTTDVRRARDSLDRAATAAHDDDAGQEAAHLEDALAVLSLPLLPEAATADWLADRREQGRVATARAARRLARLRIDAGDLDSAVASCRASLRADRYSSPTWELLVAVHERRGDAAAAALAREGHVEVLHQLDVDAEQRV